MGQLPHACLRAANFPVWLFCLQIIAGPATALAQNTKLVVQSGSNFLVAGGNIVLNNTDLQTDGSFNSNNALLLITGNSPTAWSGATALQAGAVTLNTSAISILTLNNTLQFSGPLIFQNGIIDLNNQQLQLTGSALLQAESETSHLIGPNGGFVTAGASGVSNPFQLNPGNLGAVITSSANIGNLAVSRFGKAATNPGNLSLRGIQRSFLIQPQNNTALNATLRFYYLDAELNGDDPNTLTLWKSSDGIAWMKIGADSRNTVAKYVEKTGIADFSYWTLTDALNALPLSLVSFNAKCATGYTQLQWQTGTESGIDHFDIERSTDAASWTKLGEIPCSNSTGGASYSFRDKDALPAAFFRLKIVSLPGTVTYSPVFKGGCADIALPFTAYPNPSHNNASAQISVREAGNAVIKLVDGLGRVLYNAEWKLQPGINLHPLPVNTLATGTYFIQLELAHSILQTTLVKQ